MPSWYIRDCVTTRGLKVWGTISRSKQRNKKKIFFLKIPGVLNSSQRPSSTDDKEGQKQVQSFEQANMEAMTKYIWFILESRMWGASGHEVYMAQRHRADWKVKMDLQRDKGHSNIKVSCDGLRYLQKEWPYGVTYRWTLEKPPHRVWKR